MTSERCPVAQSRGFVVAMRAKLIDSSGPLHSEWIIVSRWGIHGEYVSLGWTALPADPGDTPIHLTPRQTAVAVQQERSGPWKPTTFRLTPAIPDQLTVAGDFIPAEGHVRLYGNGSALRMRSEGKCLNPDLRSAWTMEARRALWIGEFIQRKTEP